MADVQIAVIDDTENVVNVAVPGIQGPIGTTGSVTIAQAGTAATPGIRFESDTNTGIYSPGADQLAISTGGTGRLFIDSSGRVGIGTSSPGYLLDVVSTGESNVRIKSGSTASAYLRIGTASKDFAIYADQTSSSLNFYDITAASERLRIDSSGRVGIGTSAPSDMLHINGGQIRIQKDVPQILFRSGDGTSNQYYVGANISDAVDGGFVIGEGPGITGGTPRIAISAAGNVGIGTSSPSGRLSIRSDRATETYAATIGTNNGVTFENDFVFGFNGTVQSIGNFQNFPLALITNNTERARIDSSGRLLVGTSTARANFFNSSFTNKVQIEGTSFQNSGLSVICNNSSILEAAAINFNKSAADSIGSNTLTGNNHKLGLLTFQGNDGTQFIDAARIEAFVDGDSSVDDMPGRLVFLTTADGASNPTERLRITSAGVLQIAEAGNISVGTTTGTKIGTATTQKLGFYNATPVVQPTAVADATDAASAITQLNALLTRMRNLGLIAT